MTIDEAIKHCLEVADKNEISAITFKNCKEIKTNMYEKLTAEKAESDCLQCATDHRQLAEWLTDYKELREKIKKLEKELEVAKLINHAEFKTLCKYNHVGGSENGT